MEVNDLHFVAARPPQSRTAVIKKNGVIKLEDWLVFQYERERASKNSPLHVVFICADGIASATAAKNQLRYHNDCHSFFASLDDDEVLRAFNSKSFKKWSTQAINRTK